MVLLTHGVDVEEGDLRTRCDSTILGTDALKAIDAVRDLGFEGSAKYTLTLSELRELAKVGSFPIVFVSLLPIDALDDIHSLVVLGFSRREVNVLDPLEGERSIPLQTFSAAWGMRHNLAIIVRR
jgi:hypothetical protein